MLTPRKSEKQIFVSSTGNSEKILIALLSAIREHENGSQMHLREDMAELYRYANDIRRDPEQFVAFLDFKPVSQLKRKPKSAEQVLRAVMNLAYPEKLASARYRRLKASWEAHLPCGQVRMDLVKNGSSRRRMRLEAEPNSFATFRLDQLSPGTTVGMYIWATAESSERLVVEIIDVLEWPDCLGQQQKKQQEHRFPTGFRGSKLS